MPTDPATIAPVPTGGPRRTELLRLDAIRTDGNTQPRAELLPELVDEYCLAWQGGAEFPAVIVFHDGKDFWLVDGFHRHAAAKKAGAQAILADVRQGTLQDARWFSFSVNQKHGLRRTNADKARAVQAALLHSPDKSDAEIARHVGVDDHTVAKYRSQTSTSSEIPKIETPAAAPPARTVTRKGTTYKMKVHRIGRHRPRKQPATPAEPEDAVSGENPAKRIMTKAEYEAQAQEAPTTTLSARPASPISPATFKPKLLKPSYSGDGLIRGYVEKIRWMLDDMCRRLPPPERIDAVLKAVTHFIQKLQQYKGTLEDTNHE